MFAPLYACSVGIRPQTSSCALRIGNKILTRRISKVTGYSQHLNLDIDCANQEGYNLTNDVTMKHVSSTTPVSLPLFIAEKLATLKSDVIRYLSDQCMSTLEKIVENPSDFTKNLQDMAKYYFSQNGKLIRPTLSLLIGSACNQLQGVDKHVTLDQYRIAMVSEMIHTASLIHDDVIDQSDLRRGHPTANARWGNRQAVLVGDFILARATKVLCLIGKPDVISTMAEVVEDLVKGELMQLAHIDPSPSTRFDHYVSKNFYKTASLFTNSCKSVAMLSGCGNDAAMVNAAAEVGRNLGLAFQIIDDVLDYESSAKDLGKPTTNDLRQGLATCPVLFAAEEYPELNTLIDRRFSHSGDDALAYEIVLNSRGLKRSREMARKHIVSSLEFVKCFPAGDVRRSLEGIIESIGNRKQ